MKPRKPRPAPKPRNPHAWALAEALFRPRVTPSRPDAERRAAEKHKAKPPKE